MEYISLDSVPHFSDCSPLVTGLGYVLVDLKVVPQHGSIRVTAVITKPAGESGAVGVNDCARERKPFGLQGFLRPLVRWACV